MPTCSTAPSGTACSSLFLQRCESLREFLCASEAMDLLGEEAAVEAFRAFLHSAEARSFRYKESAMQGEEQPPQLLTPLPIPAGGASAHSLPPPDVQMADVEVLQATTARLVGPRSGLHSPVGGASSSSPCLLPPTWKLQTLSSATSLHRQEYSDPGLAWAAFDDAACANIPCKLEDPAGTDAAGHNWLIVDHTTSGALGTTTAASPGTEGGRLRRRTEPAAASQQVASLPQLHLAASPSISRTPPLSVAPSPLYTPNHSYVPPLTPPPVVVIPLA